jgi:hypothetical protein
VYEVKRSGKEYTISTSGFSNPFLLETPTVGTRIKITPRGESEVKLLESLKTGDHFNVKGKVTGVSMRSVGLEPAVFWPEEPSKIKQLPAPKAEVIAKPVLADHTASINLYTLSCIAHSKMMAINLGGMEEKEAETHAAKSCLSSQKKFKNCLQNEGATAEVCTKIADTSAE